MNRLLVVDDDAHLRKLVATYVEIEGFNYSLAENGKVALSLLENNNYSLVILDIMMPVLDGFKTLEAIRTFSDIPVIVLTSRDEEYDKLRGFNLGADDYISKPFSPKELMARVKAVLKRQNQTLIESLCFGDLIIEPHTRRIYDSNDSFSLTPKEFELLMYLVKNEKLVLSREQLLENVWGFNYPGEIRTVDTHIKTLREHLGSYRSMIHTIWGVGYKFENL